MSGIVLLKSGREMAINMIQDLLFGKPSPVSKSLDPFIWFCLR